MQTSLKPQHLYTNIQHTAHVVCAQQPVSFGVPNRPGSQHSHLVQKQLIGTWAVLLKRGWVDQTVEERHAGFAEVEHTVAATRDAAARRTAIQILEVGVGSCLLHPRLALAFLRCCFNRKWTHST